MRLIDADEFKVKIAELLENNNEPYSHYCDGYQDAVEWVDDLLDAQPTIEPVKRGKWIKSDDYYTGAYETLYYYKCSECQNESLEDEFGVGNYCRWCGAEMDG